jgi:hypothetical protein
LILFHLDLILAPSLIFPSFFHFIFFPFLVEIILSSVLRLRGGLYYKYSLNHLGKDVHNYSPLSIHTLILRAFIIQKQEQTLIFLEFKAYYLIYCNSLLKSHWHTIWGSLNSTKSDCFAGIELSTTNHLFIELQRREYWLMCD